MNPLTEAEIETALRNGESVFLAFVPIITKNLGVAKIWLMIPGDHLRFKDHMIRKNWKTVNSVIYADPGENELAVFTNYWYAYAFVRKHGFDVTGYRHLDLSSRY